MAAAALALHVLPLPLFVVGSKPGIWLTAAPTYVFSLLAAASKPVIPLTGAAFGSLPYDSEVPDRIQDIARLLHREL
jgi:hypothetical protein